MTDPNSVEWHIADLIKPRPLDLLEARQIILTTLAEKPTAAYQDFVEQLLARRGVSGGEEYGDRLQIRRDTDARAAIDPDDPIIVRRRVDRSVRETLALLIGEGVLTAAAGTQYGEAVINVPYASGMAAGGLQVADHSPSFGADPRNMRWRLLRADSHPVQQLASVNLAEGLDGLLGIRGLQVLEEAIRCFNRGMYLAAVDLLAAASEAAWFTLGAHVHTDRRLHAFVERGENAGEVIERTAGGISQAGALYRNDLADVRATAGRLRQLRNYGLHPIGDVAEQHEAAFTEPGAALHFMSARSYFLTLRAALDALVETERAAPSDDQL